MKKVKVWLSNVKHTVLPALKAVGKWIVKIGKILLRIIFGLLIIAALLAFFVIPFLNTKIQICLAQWIWYPSLTFLAIALTVSCLKADKAEKELPIYDTLGKWGLVSIGMTFISVFVFHYYEIDAIWHWVIFVTVAALVPLFWFSLLYADWKYNQRGKDEKQVASINLAKNTLLCWFYDLLYISIVEGWLAATIIFGVLALIIVGFNLVNAFLNGQKVLRFFIVVELVGGLAISTYLIAIIPNDDIQNIVLTIAAALLGGIFTLVGVAWTIKKGDEDRKADLQRLEDDRREETRRKYTPYIMLADVTLSDHFAEVAYTNNLDFCASKNIDRVQDDTYYVVKLNPFIIKNVSHSNLILKGLFINEFYHKFTFDTLIEQKSTCGIQIGSNHWFALPEKITSVQLLVHDILLNEYTVNCMFLEEMDQSPCREVAPDGKEYTVKSFSYNVKSIDLPRYREKE